MTHTSYRPGYSMKILPLLPWFAVLGVTAVAHAKPRTPAVARPAPGTAAPPGGSSPTATPPLVTREVIDFTLRFEGGKVRVVRAQLASLAEPKALPRFIGRFHLELVAAQDQQLDAIRFDFPLLARLPEASAEAEADARRAERTFHAETLVRVPLDPRVRAFRVRDARAGRTVILDARWIAALVREVSPDASAPSLPAPRKRSPSSGRRASPPR